MKNILIWGIRLYQQTVSPDHSITARIQGFRGCKFYPSCSQYAIDAIEQRGAARGLIQGLKRVVRCHPWSLGGYDPVSKE